MGSNPAGDAIPFWEAAPRPTRSVPLIRQGNAVCKEAARSLASLHRSILGCRRCERAGLISSARPVVAGEAGARVMLIGQAPGAEERELRVPFMGRSGHQLVRWMRRAGFHSEAEFRRIVYLTAVTKCYPGKAVGGSGDRRPSAAEIELCRPHLERQMAVLQPSLIILVGRLAVGRFLPNRPLESVVGRAFDLQGTVLGDRRVGTAGPVLLPLPHPSGASRWMNDQGHRVLLERALGLLRAYLRDRVRARR